MMRFHTRRRLESAVDLLGALYGEVAGLLDGSERDALSSARAALQRLLDDQAATRRTAGSVFGDRPQRLKP